MKSKSPPLRSLTHCIHISRTRVESAYGELEDMPPLSPDQLRSPAVPRFQEPLVYEPPRSAQKPSNLYKDAPSSASQKLLDATQSIAHTVVETLSPRKSRDVDPLVRAPAPKSTKDVLLGLIPSSLTSIWSSEQDDGDEQPRGVEVTTALQYGAPPSSAPTATARKGPISYGGAYSMSPYQLARPTHVTVSDFPSPSHTPYNPAVRSRR